MKRKGFAVTKASSDPARWTTPGQAFDVRGMSDVEVQLVGAFTPYTPQRSLDGINFVACNAYDKDGNPVATITAPGIYAMDGGGYLKLANGAGATVTVRASQ